MPYNEDAREPSSVTGKALGTLALVGAVGGGGFAAYKAGSKAIKKVVPKVKKIVDDNAHVVGDMLTGGVGGRAVQQVKDKAVGEAILQNATSNINNKLPVIKNTPLTSAPKTTTYSRQVAEQIF